MDEQELEIQRVISAQGGNPQAFDALARHYRPALRLVVARIVPGPLVDDAVQDALITAYKALPKLADPARFGPWLATIARRRAIKSLQKPRERTGLDEMILAYLPSVSTHLIEAERNQRLKCAIRELGEELQACVVLYYGHDWSVREVADFLHLPNTTVKWRLHEARRQLRHRLTDLLENES